MVGLPGRLHLRDEEFQVWQVPQVRGRCAHRLTGLEGEEQSSHVWYALPKLLYSLTLGNMVPAVTCSMAAAGQTPKHPCGTRTACFAPQPPDSNALKTLQNHMVRTEHVDVIEA